MEFESMDNCFPKAQDDSATTWNGPSTRVPMARTKSDLAGCGLSPASTVTASTAAITAPFQSPRFDTISARYGHSLRKFLSNSVTLPVVAATTGAIAWSGYLAVIPLSLIAPLLVYCAKSRTHAFSIMFCYYSAATWPVIPGARAFFGDQGSPLIGLFLCLTAATLLALPWGLLFMRGEGKPHCMSRFASLSPRPHRSGSSGGLHHSFQQAFFSQARNGWVWASSSFF